MTEQSIENLIEDFSSQVSSTKVVKNWSLIFKGKEINGTHIFEQDDWGFYEKTAEIDEICKQDLTGDEIDAIIEYVEDLCS